MRTYVVRVQDSRTRENEPDSLCGVADEIATGRRATFTCGAELLDLLAGQRTHDDQPSESARPGMKGTR
jgi:hypothetical protein